MSTHPQPEKGKPADDVHKARDIDPVLNKSHHSPEHYTLNTPEETLFHSNSSCVLSPEVTEGPFCEYQIH